MPSKEFLELKKRLTAAPVKGDTSVEEARAGFEALMTEYTPAVDIADVEQKTVRAGTVPARWIAAPGAKEDRVILYLHGGGFTMGSVKSHLDILERLSRAVSARVLAIEYRLAPEAPFPAAVDDCVEAYHWLLESGCDSPRIVVAGSSAGGGLVMSTLLVLRDAGDPLPAAGVCLCPFVDMTLQSRSLNTNQGKDWVTRSRVEAIIQTYLVGADPAQPLASPVLADLTGLPPLFIQVGSHEIILDDVRRLAERAEADGVQVDLDIWPEMIHIWQLFASFVPEGRDAIAKLADTLIEKIDSWS